MQQIRKELDQSRAGRFASDYMDMTGDFSQILQNLSFILKILAFGIFSKKFQI